MTRTKSTYLALLAVLLSPMAANADLIDFNSGLDAAFSYTSVFAYSAPCSGCFAGTGYQNVLDATSGNGAVFNPSASSPSDFFWNGPDTFDFTSFLIAGAWGDQTLTIQGWNNGVLLQSALLAVTANPITFSPNWSGLDQIRILIDPNGYIDRELGGFGQHWALDDLVIDANVPEPGTLALFGIGLAAMGLARRKKKT